MFTYLKLKNFKSFGDIEFNFKKISEEELTVADSYKERLDETRNEFLINIDKDDYRYVRLYNKFKDLLVKRNIEDTTSDQMKETMDTLDSLIHDAHQLNVKNGMYLNKYMGDEKYVKIHKRVLDKIPKFDERMLNNI